MPVRPGSSHALPTFSQTWTLTTVSRGSYQQAQLNPLGKVHCEMLCRASRAAHVPRSGDESLVAIDKDDLAVDGTGVVAGDDRDAVHAH